MAKEQWTYQQYDPVTRGFTPCEPEEEPAGEVIRLYEPQPDEDPVDVWGEVFAARDARSARCRIVSFQ